MNLTTNYLGLQLKHPIVASASPISRTLDGIKRLEDSGAAAIVMFSLFEEQILREQVMYDHFSSVTGESASESLSFFPPLREYNVRPDSYLNLLRRASETCSVPIIASLNGSTEGGWIDYAKSLEQAGAAALELNVFYLPLDLDARGRDVEDRYVNVTKAVTSSVDIAVAVKLSPYFSSTGEMAVRLSRAGADGLVLFNRFYQPDIDLERMEVVPTLELSQSSEMRLPLLWIATLYGHVESSLAASTGVHRFEDAVKYVLAGADVVMSTSALIEHGPEELKILISGFQKWMDRREYESVSQMKGSMSLRKVSDPSAFARANYLKILHGFRPIVVTGA